MAEMLIPSEGILLTHFILSDHVEADAAGAPIEVASRHTHVFHADGEGRRLVSDEETPIADPFFSAQSDFSNRPGLPSGAPAHGPDDGRASHLRSGDRRDTAKRPQHESGLR